MSAVSVHSLYRHVIKGFQAQALKNALLLPVGLEWDRNFAFKHSSEVSQDMAEGESHGWVSKRELLTQHDFPDLARVRPEWDSKKRILSLYLAEKLSVSADVSTLEGRRQMEQWVKDFLLTCEPFEKAYHPHLENLQLIGSLSSPQTCYTDGKLGPVSIASVDSLLDIQKKFGFEVDMRRFRINLLLIGVSPWAELSWSGKRVKIGNAVLEILKPIGRCPNVDVDPETGARRDPIFSQLKEKLGHSLFGMRANIITGGEIHLGDQIEM